MQLEWNSACFQAILSLCLKETQIFKRVIKAGENSPGVFFISSRIDEVVNFVF